MGRIIASVTISNLKDKAKRFASMPWWTLVLHVSYYPLHGKIRLGDLEEIRTVELETATQKTETGSVCGPVRMQI